MFTECITQTYVICVPSACIFFVYITNSTGWVFFPHSALCCLRVGPLNMFSSIKAAICFHTCSALSLIERCFDVIISYLDSNTGSNMSRVFAFISTIMYTTQLIQSTSVRLQNTLSMK